jgi:protein-disulfide isomerase
LSDPNCAPCTALVPLLVKWYDEYAERATILIVTRGAPSEIRGKLAGLEQRLGNVLVQKDREIAALFQANATPSAVLINPIGLVVSHLAQGGKEIMELISRLPAEIADPPSRKERQALRQGRAAVTTNAAFVPDALTDG